MLHCATNITRVLESLDLTPTWKARCIVNLWRPTRWSSLFWGLLLTVLACSVVLWGLEYKLSLYYPSQAASHQVPMAKLLSKNEQSRTLGASPYTQTSPAIKALLQRSNVLPFILFFVCAFKMPVSAFRVALNHPPLKLQQVPLEKFFVRPPPIPTS